MQIDYVRRSSLHIPIVDVNLTSCQFFFPEENLSSEMKISKMTLLKHFFLPFSHSLTHSLRLILTLSYTHSLSPSRSPQFSSNGFLFLHSCTLSEQVRERETNFSARGTKKKERKISYYFFIIFLDEKGEFFTCEITIFSLL